MKKIIVLGICIGFLAACGGNNQKESSGDGDTTADTQNTEKADLAQYDPHRGEGKFKNYDPGPFDAALAGEGKTIYNTKCQSCHKLTDERLVGPGWKGVSQKHTADWILNFITNPDAMLDQDPELQRQLEICMVRMPNQNLTDDDAKAVYAFMRENDGAK